MVMRIPVEIGPEAKVAAKVMVVRNGTLRK